MEEYVKPFGNYGNGEQRKPAETPLEIVDEVNGAANNFGCIGQIAYLVAIPLELAYWGIDKIAALPGKLSKLFPRTNKSDLTKKLN